MASAFSRFSSAMLPRSAATSHAMTSSSSRRDRRERTTSASMRFSGAYFTRLSFLHRSQW
jgi:hypothetical protein